MRGDRWPSLDALLPAKINGDGSKVSVLPQLRQEIRLIDNHQRKYQWSLMVNLLLALGLAVALAMTTFFHIGLTRVGNEDKPTIYPMYQDELHRTGFMGAVVIYHGKEFACFKVGDRPVAYTCEELSSSS